MTLNELFKNTTYDDTLFSVEDKSTIESRIFMKSVRGSEVPYITCAIRDKEIKLTPEEAVRQLYIYKLMNDYGYAASRIQLETPIHFGREVKRADIAIMDKDRPMVPYIIVELKKPKLTDGKEQLKSYCNATGAPIGVWTNGEQISCYNRKDPNFFEEISDIPKATQKLSDIINEKFTYEDLKRKDKISTQKKSLRSLIKEMEDEVLASAGVDSFEEIFKLIFTKLYDELICANDPTAYLQFRNTGDTDYELKEKIQGLFDDAKKKWEGIFTDESKILLSPSHLAVCVASLQDIKLFNNNLDVVDDAFEYLMSKAQKGEKGQYFTPRYVIDMCVKMMNPTTKDKIIDTACGSSGFTVHSIFKVWKDIRRGKGLPEGDGFTAAERIPEETNFVRDNVFAIDFDEKTVRVARTLNLIAGDGQTNVLHLNTLDYSRWGETTKQEDWIDTYNEGFKKLKKLQPAGVKDYSQFQFDLVMGEEFRTLHMCYPGDVVLTKGGRVGTAGLITQPSYVTRDLIFINASALSRKDYIVLYLFFSSSFAYKQMVRSSSMTAQPHLTITLIRDLLVCNYSNSFKDKVEKYFTTLEKLNHQAQILYSEAKQILIKELKVCTEGITSDSYTTKYLSTSFKVSGRLDAEYYQPKYDGYLSALEQFETTKIPNEFDVLKNSGTNYAEGVSDVGVIKTKQLTNSGVNTDGIESYFTHETCIENKSTLVVNNDVVFASMGVGSLGKVSLFSYDGDKPFVTDSTLRIYRAKKHTHVLPEVLCIFLQSAIGQELIYRYVVGSTGIINIYDDDIAKIPIPILDGEIQKDIAEKVQNSFALRRQSKQLLEYAKQAVEMAIEQGEDAALVWLKERSGE